jgi:hypothetical protein
MIVLDDPANPFFAHLFDPEDPERSLGSGASTGNCAGSAPAFIYEGHTGRPTLPYGGSHITISKPAAIALLIALVILAFLASYANYRLLKWYLIRRERRRESAPTK